MTIHIPPSAVAQLIADWHNRPPTNSDLDLASAIIGLVGTPGAIAPLEAPGPHLIDRSLLALDDTALHKRLIQLRDHHRAHASWYGRWIKAVRLRVARLGGDTQAAQALGTSRATIRKAAAR